ncbi:hypothetical protein L1Q82_27475, partial [Klebsiella pneumoniae]
GRDARKRAYCLKIQPATGSFARNLIYSTKPFYMEIMATIILLGADQNFSDLFGNWLTFSACSSPCLDSF